MEHYNVTGMSCAACAARVEKAVNGVPGVTGCAVSLLTNSMGVEGTAAPEAIVAAVEKAGYGAAPQNARGDAAPAATPLRDRQTPALVRRLIVSAVLLLILMYGSMGHMMWGWPLPSFFTGNHVAMGLAQMLLAGAVLLVNGRFFVSGFKSALHGAPNMDTLVAMGSGVSFAWSVYVLFRMTGAVAAGDAAGTEALMGQFYFESAAMILTLISVGKLLEARAKGKTTTALKSLMDLSPKTATVIRDGRETEIPAAGIRVGDVFVVRPGESFPADGSVLEGAGAVDESALTGESVPVDKAPGDAVSAATINRSGFLRCRATKVGEDTALAQIIRTVSDAAATKAPIAKMADRVSAVFVPVVLGIALVTFLVWLIVGKDPAYALERGVSVLVISCPCALGLATPVAVTVGSGRGARCGILFKTAQSLEETGRADVAVLDKTGTVTKGEPVVTDVLPAAGADERTLLETAVSVERGSEHPLAKAVVRYAAERGIEARQTADFTALAGLGVRATLDGRRVLAGNRALLETETALPAAVREQAEALARQGKTPLLFAADGSLLGIVAVADAVRPDSPEAVRQLKKLGLRVVMLTGDNEAAARAVGKTAGIDEVIAGVRPDGKYDAVRRLRETGRVMMVGDGVNDAPALTAADTGVAVGAGTDVAIDAADVVLMRSTLSDAAAAVRLSRRTLRNIRQNLFWAFFYNVIGIPLAAGVWIPLFGWELSPMFGAAAMSLSSFFVVTNALRLNLFDPHSDKHDKSKKARGRAGAEIKNKKQEKGEPAMTTTVVKIEGMMCPRCEAHVKEAIEKNFAVESVTASHEENRAVVTSAAPLDAEKLAAVVAEAGYTFKGVE